MNRQDFLMMREDLMTKIEVIMEENYGNNEQGDDVIGQLCDVVCEVMDPAGLSDM